jgi:hypothetical protein
MIIPIFFNAKKINDYLKIQSFYVFKFKKIKTVNKNIYW